MKMATALFARKLGVLLVLALLNSWVNGWTVQAEDAKTPSPAAKKAKPKKPTYKALLSQLDLIEKDYKEGVEKAKRRGDEAVPAEKAQAEIQSRFQLYEARRGLLQSTIDQGNEQHQKLEAQRRELEPKLEEATKLVDTFEGYVAQTAKSAAAVQPDMSIEDPIAREEARQAKAKDLLLGAKQLRDNANRNREEAKKIEPKLKALKTEMGEYEKNLSQNAADIQEVSGALETTEKDLNAKAAEATTIRGDAAKLQAGAEKTFADAKLGLVKEQVTQMEKAGFDGKLLLANWNALSAKFGAQKAQAEEQYFGALNQTLLSRYVDDKLEKKGKEILQAAQAAACNCSQPKGPGQAIIDAVGAKGLSSDPGVSKGNTKGGGEGNAGSTKTTQQP